MARDDLEVVPLMAGEQEMALLPTPTEEQGAQADDLCKALMGALTKFQDDAGTPGLHNLVAMLGVISFTAQVLQQSTMMLEPDDAKEVSFKYTNTLINIALMNVDSRVPTSKGVQ